MNNTEECKTKSTPQTSRKIYALKVAGLLVIIIVAFYSVLLAMGFNPSELVFGTAIGAIGTIVGTLNVADGMKKGE